MINTQEAVETVSYFFKVAKIKMKVYNLFFLLPVVPKEALETPKVTHLFTAEGTLLAWQ